MKLLLKFEYRCSRTFTGHRNAIHSIGAAFSPCLRFIASGSEDRCAYLFDIKSGSVLHKLHGHSDVVSGVSFNPLYPQLASCSFDGTIRFYADK